MSWINHHASATRRNRAAFRVRPLVDRLRRFPRTHTFKVTAQFNCPVRVADAQAILRAKLANFESFSDGFTVKKVRRITR